MHRSMWTYAWDLLDLGFDAALEELRDRAGFNCISLATDASAMGGARDPAQGRRGHS
jgi:hypothetical protein